MITVSELRQRADRCFDSAQTAADPDEQQEARAQGYRYLKQADAVERAEAAGLLPGLALVASERMSPIQNVALIQLARVEAHISAIEAEEPPAHSARANILTALLRKKAELEQVCGVRIIEALRR
jgi:hypothetical protein